jgi:hypothetical protein
MPGPQPQYPIELSETSEAADASQPELHCAAEVQRPDGAGPPAPRWSNTQIAVWWAPGHGAGVAATLTGREPVVSELLIWYFLLEYECYQLCVKVL